MTLRAIAHAALMHDCPLAAAPPGAASPLANVLIGHRGEGLSMGYHPLASRKAIGSGRMFYTAIGHQPENDNEPHAAALLAEGIAWAMGSKGSHPHD